MHDHVDEIHDVRLGDERRHAIATELLGVHDAVGACPQQLCF